MLKILFMGTPAFSVPILEALINNYQVIGVVTQPDKLVGRKKKLTSSPVKICALKHNIPVFQPLKIRNDYEAIIALNPDLIVTAAYGQIVGMKLLNAPKYRSINVHASLLPKYRGGAPIQHAIKNGDKETGITIMYMEKEMDAGDIINQRSLEIKEDDTAGSLFEKLSYLGRDLLLETIPLLINNQITPISQNTLKATFAYNIKPSDEKLDFNKPALDVYNHIRALLPEPGAYFQLGEKVDDKIKVYASKVSNHHHQTKPGSLIKVAKDYFTIACGNNTSLDIYSVQPSGKKIMTSRDFINGAFKKYL